MYREKYYNYQTIARGMLDKTSLEAHFIKLDKLYWSILKNIIPKNKEINCVDLPCGYGNFLYFLKQHGYKNVIGFDLDVEQVKLAQLLALPAFQADVFEKLNSNKESYDLISSFDFIEHISKDQALNFIELSYEKLNTNGLLIIRTPCADGPFGSHDANNDLTHEWSMTSNVLKTVLEMSGFKNVIIIDEYPRPIGVVSFVRWLVYIPTKCLASIFYICLGIRPPRVWSRSMMAVAYKS